MSSGCWPLQPRSGYMDMSGTSDPVDGEECRYCKRDAVVPVLDKSIERNPAGGGNKYRRRCTACDRWAPMCSEDHYRDHAHPHVLPVDADADAEGSILPLEQYDYGPEWNDLVDRVTESDPSPSEEPSPSDAAGGAGRRAMTDGGEVADDDEPSGNVFDCPWCGEQQHGKPECCGDCGAEYEW